MRRSIMTSGIITGDSNLALLRVIGNLVGRKWVTNKKTQHVLAFCLSGGVKYSTIDTT